MHASKLGSNPLGPQFCTHTCARDKFNDRRRCRSIYPATRLHRSQKYESLIVTLAETFIVSHLKTKVKQKRRTRGIAIPGIEAELQTLYAYREKGGEMSKLATLQNKNIGPVVKRLSSGKYFYSRCRTPNSFHNIDILCIMESTTIIDVNLNMQSLSLFVDIQWRDSHNLFVLRHNKLFKFIKD